ncbi:MAG: PLP-dependent transferase [Alphaproteobacteria bacterium]
MTPDDPLAAPTFDGEGLGTLLAHDPPGIYGAVVPPIVQTSLFTFPSYAEMEARFHGRSSRHIYSRGDNPTVQAFEEKIRVLEGGEAARAVSSGMAAIACAVLANVEAGDRIVCVRDVYPDAFRLFRLLLTRFGVRVDFVDGGDPAAIEAAAPGAKLIYLENPTSLTFRTQDLAAMVAIARRHGLVSVIDNSWATPVFQRPLAHGVDIVVHSASKYISGHSDTIAGVIVTSAAHMARIMTLTYPVLGPKLAPFEGWLLLRGLRTLDLRMRRHQASTATIVERLRASPHVEAVHWPGPDGCGTLTGASGLFGVTLAAHVDIARFCDALRLFRLGISWGGHESLAFPARIGLTIPNAPANSLVEFGVPDRLVRLNVGLEEADDLWADLDQALAQAATGPARSEARTKEGELQ